MLRRCRSFLRLAAGRVEDAPSEFGALPVRRSYPGDPYTHETVADEPHRVGVMLRDVRRIDELCIVRNPCDFVSASAHIRLMVSRSPRRRETPMLAASVTQVIAAIVPWCSGMISVSLSRE